MHGPLAHLVERFHGMEEVTGPNPVWSTKKQPTSRDLVVFLFVEPICFTSWRKI